MERNYKHSVAIDDERLPRKLFEPQCIMKINRILKRRYKFKI